MFLIPAPATGAVVNELIGISDSLRRGSFNTALLRAAAELMPDRANLAVETIHGIALYDADVETAEGLPERVSALKAAIVTADGLLLVTPKYNNSIPGVFKNAIDWLLRSSADIGRVLGRKPVAIIGASPGGFRTVLSRNAWLHVLCTLGTAPWFRRSPPRIPRRERLRRNRCEFPTCSSAAQEAKFWAF